MGSAEYDEYGRQAGEVGEVWGGSDQFTPLMDIFKSRRYSILALLRFLT